MTSFVVSENRMTFLEEVVMKYIFYAMFLINFTNIYADTPSAMTFQGGGRLGDKLIVYCKAKWFSYKFNIPFLCPDFPLRDKLMLFEKEQHLTKEVENHFKYKKIVKFEKDIHPLSSDTLFAVDFYASSDEMSHIINIKNVFNNHPAFLNELRSLIAPRNPVAKLTLPEDQITVAVHVRRGSGGDRPLFHKESDRTMYSDKRWPDKFPPHEFYIEQIRRLNSIFGNQPMYVYIFTDYKYPEQIVEKYKKALDLPNISFGYRQNNPYENYVIQDLIAMTQFQCLIRANSCYSMIAYLLGDHKYMIYPIGGTWHGDHLTIDHITISTRHEDGTVSKEEIIHLTKPSIV